MVQVSYPGVYIQEVSSGVRTITGVSTSVTAFVGAAKRGPINRAIRLLSYADYERSFGGLDAKSELSYAVRQFFFNGGSEAWVIRLAKDPLAASRDLNRTTTSVLKVTAIDEGKSGNYIEMRVDYKTDNPASNFNLTFDYNPPDNPADRATETFQSLSMNSQDPRYVKSVINDTSRLVKVEPTVTQGTLNGLGQGKSLSGELLSSGSSSLIDVGSLRDDNHDRFRVVVNGLPPVTVQILSADTGAGTTGQKLQNLCTAIQTKVRNAAAGNTALSTFTCAPNGNQIEMTSGAGGEFSSVRVLPGLTNDIASRLKLGTLNGGVETDAVASVRPDALPPAGTLISGTFGATDLDTIPSASINSFRINLNGYGFDSVTVSNTAATGANLAAKLQNMASRIQTGVQALKVSNPVYQNFRCVVTSSNDKLQFISGVGGVGSSVVVDAATSNDMANALHLLTGATRVDGQNIYLQNGTESDYTAADAYNLFIASRSLRKGIFALEDVDLFNILCLPGETDPSILIDAAAYCQERRAFMIVDAPKDAKKPSEMVTVISGTALPKTDRAAVYYPWIEIADPLNSGKLRLSAPCGTIAGLYARTDSTRGVWKAPAGTEATLVGVQKAAYPLTDPENGILNPLGVNCIRVFPVYGSVNWGARTLLGADQIGSEWKYIPIRRLALFLEESLYRGTKWIVFEPNDEPLWAQIRLNLRAFMTGLFRQGAFQGSTPDKAFFVKCDGETTTQADRNLGIVNIEVGFAPLKPAEFVIIKIQQIAGDLG